MIDQTLNGDRRDPLFTAEPILHAEGLIVFARLTFRSKLSTLERPQEQHFQGISSRRFGSANRRNNLQMCGPPKSMTFSARLLLS